MDRNIFRIDDSSPTGGDNKQSPFQKLNTAGSINKLGFLSGAFAGEVLQKKGDSMMNVSGLTMNFN